MTVMEANVYAIAEMLGQPVTVLKRLPASEYWGWVRYMRYKREQEQEKDNPLASGDAMLRAFKLG